MIIKGGHAIMLRTKLTAREEGAAKSFLHGQIFATTDADKWGKDLAGKILTDDPHLTLAFVGRDLDHEISDKMIAVAGACIEAGALPQTIKSTGNLALFGRRDHLVSEIEADFNLTRLRDMLVRRLLAASVPVATRYAFKPHVSLAKLNHPTNAGYPTTLSPTEFPVLGIGVKLGSSIVSLSR